VPSEDVLEDDDELDAAWEAQDLEALSRHRDIAVNRTSRRNSSENHTEHPEDASELELSEEA
jgi:hypothetical protein